MTTNPRSRFWACVLGSALTAATVAPGTYAGGWRRDEQGAKATALAQAFTAQADDPSAVTYNPAGLAFLEDRAFSAGFTLGLASNNRFEGFDPVPGTGAAGQRRMDPLPVPHVYWVEPVARRWAVVLVKMIGHREADLADRIVNGRDLQRRAVNGRAKCIAHAQATRHVDLIELQ